MNEELRGDYLSWDDPEDRLRIQKREMLLDPNLWVFDELHKFRRWRNYLKGIFDRYSLRKKF